jgi:dihydroneopterin aldolase
VSDRITIRGMQFAARLGVEDPERAQSQPIEVDLVLHLDLSRAAATDALSDTADYAAAFAMTRSIVAERAFHLVEALAGAIAEAALATLPVDEVEVAVRKPKAPLDGAFETVEVAVRRRRGEPIG